jgi:hypothetical protein
MWCLYRRDPQRTLDLVRVQEPRMTFLYEADDRGDEALHLDAVTG